MSYNKLAKGFNASTSGINPLDLIKELKDLHKQARKIDPTISTKTSPYLHDQSDYKPQMIKDTLKERNWRQVSTSRDEEVAKIIKQSDNKKRLNII